MPLSARLARAGRTASVAAVLIAAALYVLAVTALAAGGPSASGYARLLTANQAAVAAAIVVALASLGAAPERRRRTTVALAVASGVSLLIAGGLLALGTSLAGIDPVAQPRDLYSLLLAIAGSGHDLLPVPPVLALGAAAGTVVGRVRARRTALPAS